MARIEIIMKVITSQVRSIFDEISHANFKTILFCLASGFVAVLWPLGGVLLFIVSRFSDETLFGRFALLCSILVMCATAFGLLFK